MVLPSISEDDENQSDAESKHTQSPSKSNSLIRSPLHGSPSPRHGKFLQRYFHLMCMFSFFHFFCWFTCLLACWLARLWNTYTYTSKWIHANAEHPSLIRLTRIHLRCFLIKWIKWKKASKKEEVYRLANETTRRIMIVNGNMMQVASFSCFFSLFW